MQVEYRSLRSEKNCSQSSELSLIVMGDTEYSVIDTSDTTSSDIGIDY